MDDDLEQYLKYTKESGIDEFNYSDKGDLDDANSRITLPPDHPLLAKFQQSLKSQLEKQIRKLTDEVTALNIDIKKQTEYRDVVGVKVYEGQQLLSKQQENIEGYETEILKLAQERIEIEEEMQQQSKTFKEKKDELNKAEAKDLELQNEIESLNYLMLKMTEWERDLLSDLAVNKRISEKSKQDKKMLSEEKRNLDFIIYKLMTEIFKLENSLEQCNMQLIAKEKERDELADLIASSNADQEALEAELRRLMHSWNCVLVAISHRDKTYFAAKTDLENAREELTQAITSVGIEKKICNEEMLHNEQLTMIKERIDTEKTNVTAKINNEEDKLAKIDNKVEEIQALLNQTVRDLDQVSAVCKMKQRELDQVRRDVEKQHRQKMEIEENMLNLLQEQMANDKVSKYMNKQIQEKRECNRNMEISIAGLENQNATIEVDIEKQKAANEAIQRFVDELTREQSEKDVELGKHMNVLHDSKLKIIKLQRFFDNLSKKLEETIQKAGGIEMSPDEIKIKSLEKLIVEGEEKNKISQNLWLRQQSYVVELSDKRQKQLAEINLCRKQTLILEQKNLKLEDELEELDMQERLMSREINNMHIKLDKVFIELTKKKELKDELDKTTTFTQIEYSNELKEMEMECLRLETEIADMENEKAQLSKDMLDINREILIWDKKVQMANETKKSIEEDKGGDLGNMQTEIHRMKIRYGQLKKAQDKLIQDLQFTLSRRDSIWNWAAAEEARATKGGPPKNRSVLQRKLEDIKAKIKKTEKEKKITEEKIESSFKLEKEMTEELRKTEIEIEEANKEIAEIIKELEDGEIRKQMSLESLVFTQNKAKYTSSVTKGTYKKLFKNTSDMEAAYSKEVAKNMKLQIIIDNLMGNFPQYVLKFQKILHTLKLVME